MLNKTAVKVGEKINFTIVLKNGSHSEISNATVTEVVKVKPIAQILIAEWNSKKYEVHFFGRFESGICKAEGYLN